MIDDANSNLVVTSNVQVIGSPDAIANVDPFTDQDARVTQQKILPNTVNARAIGDLLTNNPTNLALGQSAIFSHLVIPDQTSGHFSFKLADNQGREVMAVPEISFFILSNGVFQHWPSADFGMGNMPTSVFSDWGDSDNFNQVVSATIRNNTGSAKTIYTACRFRLITFPSNRQVGTQHVDLPSSTSSTIAPTSGSGGGTLPIF